MVYSLFFFFKKLFLEQNTIGYHWVIQYSSVIQPLIHNNVPTLTISQGQLVLVVPYQWDTMCSDINLPLRYICSTSPNYFSIIQKIKRPILEIILRPLIYRGN